MTRTHGSDYIRPDTGISNGSLPPSDRAKEHAALSDTVCRANATRIALGKTQV